VLNLPDERCSSGQFGFGDTLTDVGECLHTVSVQSGDAELSDWIRCLFGTSNCPECGKPFSLPDATAQIDEQ
jgi:hypothetical protein